MTPKYIERSKLTTNLMAQSTGLISDLWQNSPIPLHIGFQASIFTAVNPMDVVPNKDVMYQAMVRDITTLYDSYMNKTDLVILLDCPEIRTRQAELKAAGYTSVYASEEPCLVLSDNIPQLMRPINTFINGLRDFVAHRKGNLYLYFKGEELVGTFGYPLNTKDSANNQAKSKGAGYVRPEGVIVK